ncbi:MAG: nucleotidyltransferase domain-containing protein [Ilumatobacter sp.]
MADWGQATKSEGAGLGGACEDLYMDSHAEVLESLAPGLVERLTSVDGVIGVDLGGSRARGDHAPDSDYDLGVYYDGSLDVGAVQSLADEYSSTPCAMSAAGGWGPWVDGGGWLTVDGTPIDLIYRDVNRVQTVWAECVEGVYRNEVQAGHPLGFWSHAYAGEVALGVVLADTDGRLRSLQDETREYPQPLAQSLVAASWEASFSMSNARKAVDRQDVAYVVGCMFRAVGVLTHSLHGFERRWLLNEKGAVSASNRLSSAPEAFADRVSTAFDLTGRTAKQLDSACASLEALIDETQERLR